MKQDLPKDNHSAYRKLGLSFFEYVRDRIAQTRNIPPLATLIYYRSSVNSFGWSWQLQ
ncbi:MAG: hypothetical protein O4808_18145 [Trichodesmium sp. St17_bin3_1_1]|nr:hypothetical protein [Trichodesmium sp. St17_bin3_1_1]